MWTYPRIIAHRGGGSLAPENTLVAFECGFNVGFRAVEFDVMLTKDHVPVVVHDEALGRTIAGSGLICETNANELCELDAGSWLGPQFSHARVPRYVDVLEFCTKHAIWMNVEIKPAKGHDALTAKIVAEMTKNFYKHHNFKFPLFSSFSMEALEVAKQVSPHVPRGALFDHLPDNWLKLAHELDVVSIHTNQKDMDQTIVSDIKQSGLGLVCYTVNDIMRAHELLEWGVDALFTDNLQQITADFI